MGQGRGDRVAAPLFCPPASWDAGVFRGVSDSSPGCLRVSRGPSPACPFGVRRAAAPRNSPRCPARHSLIRRRGEDSSGRPGGGGRGHLDLRRGCRGARNGGAVASRGPVSRGMPGRVPHPFRLTPRKIFHRASTACSRRPRTLHFRSFNPGLDRSLTGPRAPGNVPPRSAQTHAEAGRRQ